MSRGRVIVSQKEDSAINHGRWFYVGWSKLEVNIFASRGIVYQQWPYDARMQLK
jgi:hypothetical protein